jgi:hypothetical protein
MNDALDEIGEEEDDMFRKEAARRVFSRVEW